MGRWTALWDELRTFLMDVRWDRPSLLGFALVPTVLWLISWVIARRDRTRWKLIGEPAPTIPPFAPHTKAFLYSFAWMFLAIALAGPRWGTPESDGIAVGRDIAIVIDLSRSMLADDMPRGQARWQAAIDSVNQFVRQLRGGHRVSVTLFAARPLTIVPLTTDFDHIRMKLNEINGRYPPAEIRPDRDDAPSGTRIGAAVVAAIASFDERSGPGRTSCDIILVSDGDDPADDREWRQAISAARAIDRPVHVVAVGDPTAKSLIPLGQTPLEFEGPGGVPDTVRSQRDDVVLKTIATETRGEFFSLQQTPVDWPTAVTSILDPTTTREFSDADSARRPNRAGRFYLLACVGCLGVWSAHRSRSKRVVN